MENEELPQLTEAGITYFTEEKLLSQSTRLYTRLVEAADEHGLIDSILEKERRWQNNQSAMTGIQIPEVPKSELHSNAMEAWADFALIHAETDHSRRVDNFQCYLSDLLKLMFDERPELLRAYSKTQVSVEKILEHNDYRSLMARIADEIVQGASYGKATDFLGLFKKHGIDPDLNDYERTELIEAVAVRNIIVHNRGLINDKFLADVMCNKRTRERFKSRPLKRGEPFPLDEVLQSNYVRNLWNVVLKMEFCVIEKINVAASAPPHAVAGLISYIAGRVDLALSRYPSSAFSKIDYDQGNGGKESG